MTPHVRALAALCAGWAGLVLPGAAGAQCPSFSDTSLFGGHGYDGDEPDDFTHYVDADGDGACDFTGDANDNGQCDEAACEPVVAWDAENGVHPNGLYHDCLLVRYEEGTSRITMIQQLGHSHWEYTHLQDDELGQSDEKDYAAITQAMQEDFENGDSNGTATRHAIDQAIRFVLREPLRFDRFLRPSANPYGRYWQVDEWIGPAGTPPGGSGVVPVPLLSWKERFFVCGDVESGPTDCARVDGAPAYGGYWSNHAEQLHYQPECGDALLDDPAPELDDPVDPDGRNEACGILFTECF